MNLKKITFLALALAFMFTSCSNDDDVSPVIPESNYENGLIIAHQGNFTDGVGTISYVSNDYGTVENNVFANVNSRTLGQVAQSITFNDDLAYIVINASNEIEVVNRYTFESVATINSGLDNPRYMAIVNGKGYVTNWGDGTDSTDDYLAVIDLASNTTISAESISVEEGPEKIVSDGNTLYVAHLGGFGLNNIVSVIDVPSNMVTSTITVGDAPNSLDIDTEGNLWVLCAGDQYSEITTGGKLLKIRTSDFSVSTLDFSETEHPSLLSIVNDQLYYYLAGSVYNMDANDTSLPTTPQLTGLNFFGMTVGNNTVYGLDAVDFQSNGSLKVYDLNTTTEVENIELNVIPGEVYFN